MTSLVFTSQGSESCQFIRWPQRYEQKTRVDDSVHEVTNQNGKRSLRLSQVSTDHSARNRSQHFFCETAEKLLTHNADDFEKAEKKTDIVRVSGKY